MQPSARNSSSSGDPLLHRPDTIMGLCGHVQASSPLDQKIDYFTYSSDSVAARRAAIYTLTPTSFRLFGRLLVRQSRAFRLAGPQGYAWLVV